MEMNLIWQSELPYYSFQCDGMRGKRSAGFLWANKIWAVKSEINQETGREINYCPNQYQNWRPGILKTGGFIRK